MTFRGFPRVPFGALAGAALFLAAASPTPVAAATAAYHLDGKVVSVTGAAASGLQALGAVAGADIDIDWTVELTTPVSFDSGAPDNRKEYMHAVKAFEIRVGTWKSEADPNSVINIVTVANDVSGTPQDAMHVAQGGTDTNLLLRGGGGDGSLVLSLDLAAPQGGASSNNSLGQNPNLYTGRTGNVVGANGLVYFEVTGGGTSGPTGDPTQKCRAAQLSSAAALCQAEFKCLAKRAKAPTKDPLGLTAEACREKARQKYLKSFDKAAANAAKKNLSCGYTGPGTTPLTHLGDAIDDVFDGVDAIDPEVPAVNSAWLTGAATLCSAGIKAESANAAKPNAAKLSQARSTARSKLIMAATKAVANAEKKGPVYDPDPSAPDFADSIDSLIDDVSAELNGD